ncbi:MAG: 30S ribosomal protein S25e, partial [Thermosphaera sp.]
TLANQLNIKISVARRILREAERKGILTLYSGGRRTPIYIPAR